MKQHLQHYFTVFLLFISTISFAQNALHFDGTGDYVQTTFPGVMGSNNRTFEAWIYVDIGASASNLCILDYGLNAVGSRNTFSVTGTRGLTYISGGTNANISSAASVISEGVWTHVAFVLDNGTGYLYVNGSQVGTGSLTTVNTPSGNQNLIIGERVSGGSIMFEGMIDEVRVWNTARSEQEIQADTSNEFCAFPSNLVAYYKFNQGVAGGNNSGVTTLEEHIAANNGPLTGFALNGSTSNWVAGKSLVSSVLTNETVTECDSFVSPSGKYTWTVPGTYYDTLATSYGCDSVLEIELTIITVDPSVSISGNTIASGDVGATYQWLNCDSNYTPVAGETSQSFTVTANGSYAVRVEKIGCVDTSICVDVTWIGLDEISPNALIDIYPNPTKGDFFINGAVSGRLSVTDAKGVMVYETILTGNSNESVSLPASLRSGLYLVSLQSEAGYIRKKLFVQRD